MSGLINGTTLLLCVHAWGNTQFPYSGAYRYITNFYGLSFHTYSKIFNFDKVCQKALSELNNLVISEFAFDYIFIDESQDFPDSFKYQLKSKHVFITKTL